MALVYELGQVIFASPQHMLQGMNENALGSCQYGSTIGYRII